MSEKGFGSGKDGSSLGEGRLDRGLLVLNILLVKLLGTSLTDRTIKSAEASKLMSRSVCCTRVVQYTIC